MEYVLAFVLFGNGETKVELESAYMFADYSECERFARNETREMILAKYSGQKIKVVPACKELDQQTKNRIKNEEIGF